MLHSPYSSPRRGGRMYCMFGSGGVAGTVPRRELHHRPQPRASRKSFHWRFNVSQQAVQLENHLNTSCLTVRSGRSTFDLHRSPLCYAFFGALFPPRTLLASRRHAPRHSMPRPRTVHISFTAIMHHTSSSSSLNQNSECTSRSRLRSTGSPSLRTRSSKKRPLLCWTEQESDGRCSTVLDRQDVRWLLCCGSHLIMILDY